MSGRSSTRRPLFLILLGLMAAMGTAVGLYYPSSPAPVPKAIPHPKPEPPAAPKASTPAPAPKPAAKPPAPPPPTRVTREERARVALDRILKFEGLRPDDAKERIARLEAFIGRHPDTFAAARAAGLIASLKAPPKVEPPVDATEPPPR